MISELVSSLQAQIRERLSNPFLSLFSIALITHNYKVWVLLFSDLAPERKFSLISELYPSIGDSIWGFIIFPSLIAIGFIVVYPIVNFGTTYVWFNLQKKVNFLKYRIEGSQLLTKDQSIALRSENAELNIKVRELEDSVAESNAIIHDLREKAGIEGVVDQFTKHIPTRDDVALSEGEHRLLSLIMRGDRIFDSYIIYADAEELKAFDNIEIRALFRGLADKGLIGSGWQNQGGIQILPAAEDYYMAFIKRSKPSIFVANQSGAKIYPPQNEKKA